MGRRIILSEEEKRSIREMYNMDNNIELTPLEYVNSTYLVASLIKKKFGNSLKISIFDIEKLVKDIITDRKLSDDEHKKFMSKDKVYLSDTIDLYDDKTKKLVRFLISGRSDEMSSLIDKKVGIIDSEIKKNKTGGELSIKEIVNIVSTILDKVDFSDLKPYREESGLTKNELISLVYDRIKDLKGTALAMSIWPILKLLNI